MFCITQTWTDDKMLVRSTCFLLSTAKFLERASTVSVVLTELYMDYSKYSERNTVSFIFQRQDFLFYSIFHTVTSIKNLKLY